MTQMGDAMMKTKYEAQKTITLHFFKQMKLIPVSEFHKRNFRKLRESAVDSGPSTLKRNKLIIHSKANKNLSK